MKKTILIMMFPVLLLVVLIQTKTLTIPEEEHIAVTVEKASLALVDAPEEVNDPFNTGSSSKRIEIVNYALTLLGSPYLFGGNTKSGFDCSGFTTHVFKMYGVAVKRSSSLQATEGKEINRSEAEPGDLIIFTGTNSQIRKPGHVGIVISAPGEPIEFIHSSSARRESGVKISQVEGSGYEDRFMAVRRVL